MTASILRRLDRLEAAQHSGKPVLVAFGTHAEADAFRAARQHGAERPAFMPLIVITGVPRNPGDPMPDDPRTHA